MNTTIPTELDEQFAKRMDIERQELGRAIRELEYVRAWGVAEYIANQLLERVEVLRGNLR